MPQSPPRALPPPAAKLRASCCNKLRPSSRHSGKGFVCPGRREPAVLRQPLPRVRLRKRRLAPNCPGPLLTYPFELLFDGGLAAFPDHSSRSRFRSSIIALSTPLPLSEPRRLLI